MTWPPVSEPELRPPIPERTDHGYRCGVCGEEFRYKYQLKDHKEQKHAS